jgi:hypothetical protein
LPARALVTLQAGGTPLATGNVTGARMKSGTNELPSPDEKQSKLVAYPNPLNDESLTIDLSAIPKSSKVIQINLKNMSGKVIATYSVSSDKLEIKREELPGKGIYLIEVNTGNGIETMKLLVE